MSKCIIHIGMHKTGSTSIQKSLDGFHDQEFFYAHLGNTPNHSLAIFSLFSSHPERHHLHIARGRDSAAIKLYLSIIYISLGERTHGQHDNAGF